MNQRTLVLLAIAAASLAAVGAALVSQYRFDMQPCPWCVLQRLIFLAIAALAFVALAWRGRLGSLVCGEGMLTLAGCGAAAALWQHFVAAASASCKLTLAERIISTLGLDERWPEVFTAYASCADAATRLLGVPYEFWSLALYVLLGGAALRLMLAALRSSPQNHATGLR